MEKTTLIKYEDIEFEVVYALDEGCEGDWQTPPKQPDAFITEVLIAVSYTHLTLPTTSRV